MNKTQKKELAESRKCSFSPGLEGEMENLAARILEDFWRKTEKAWGHPPQDEFSSTLGCGAWLKLSCYLEDNYCPSQTTKRLYDLGMAWLDDPLRQIYLKRCSAEAKLKVNDPDGYHWLNV